MIVCGNDRETYLAALRARLDSCVSDRMREYVVSELARVAADLATFAERMTSA